MKTFRLDKIEVQHTADLSPRYKFEGVHFLNDDTYPIEFAGWDAPELQIAIAHIEAQIAKELEP